MAKMKLKVAIRYIHQYFAPLTVTIAQASPVSMDVKLTEPVSNESATLFDVPYRNTYTVPQLYHLINLIEIQVKKRNPDLFGVHVVNRLHHG